MQPRNRLLSVLALVVFLSLFGWTIQGQSASKTTWEYKIVSIQVVDSSKSETILNNVGQQGWELVTYDPHEPSGYPTGAGDYYFKRAK